MLGTTTNQTNLTNDMLLFATASHGRPQVIETFVSFVRFVVVNRPRQLAPIQESQDCCEPDSSSRVGHR